MTGQRAGEPWDGYSQVLAPGVMLVSAEAAVYLLRYTKEKIALARRDGIAPPAHLRRLHADLATTAGSGHADVRNSPDSSWSPHDEITTAEAAELLGLGVRHTRRLAERGDFGRSRVVHGRRLVQRSDVTAYLAERRQAS